MDFEALEAATGVRFTWQYWLASKQAHAKLPVPPAVLLTVGKEVQDMPVLAYNPTQCRKCKGILSCHANVDFNSKMWLCPFCQTSQPLPQHYQAISAVELPAELYPEMHVVEYQLPGAPVAPVVLFVLDLCMSAEDQQQMKLSVEQAITLLPDSTQVGVITFGSMVYVHEMAPSDIPRCVMFRGTAEASKGALAQALALGHARGAGGAGAPGSVYFQPLSECSFALESVLESMSPEAPLPGQRTQRCTGAALSVATALLESCAPHVGGRAMLFTSGPCTRGPGLIVEPSLDDAIRTHKDLAKGSAKWFRRAVEFYDKLAERLVDNGQCLDIFACALDQTGLAEMQHMVACTGGIMVMAETFEHDVYRRSLARLLRCDAAGCLAMGLNGTLEVHASKHIAVRGAIGSLASLERKSEHTPLAEPMIGLGRTSAWKVNAFDASDTVAVFFEVTAPPAAAPPTGTPLVLQFRTAYQHASGHKRLRVTTVSRFWHDAATAPASLGFDQDAAAVVMSRWAAFMAETEDTADLGRWVDQQLVTMCARYCDFVKAQVDSLQLAPDFEMYPEYIFHLRRSMFLDIFNNTPDETAFYRMMLFREPCSSCTLMLRPQLWRYGIDGAPPSLCALDVGSIDPSGVMILDSWFCVVVHTGTHIAAWRNQGYFENPDYAHIKEMVDQAHAHADALVESRNPLPRLVVCDQNGSQARFLLVRLNPSRTHENSEAAAQVLGPDQVVYTDDVSYSVFLDQLKKLAVNAP